MAISLDDFRGQVIDAGLMTADELRAFLEAIPDDRRPADGERLARALVREKKLTAFQAQTVYKGKGRSLVLGNYLVLDKLGQGGMGLVLKAEHRRMRRRVALKVLSPDVVKTPELLERFQREVRAAARLNHPNIVAAYDADEVRGTHFLVMEYVEGTDLSAFVKKRGPLPVAKAVECIVQAARGLQYAHEQGVVHRDIKPANLLLDHSGTVKVLDMGLARLDSPDGTQAELTSTGAVMGTVDYMAPEQALSTKHADARSDVYSLGISLWFLLTGRAAYEGDSLMARLLAHREAPIPSLRAARPDVPESVDAVFRKMIAKQPEHRHQSMAEVLADLQACLDGGASPPSLSGGPSEDSKLEDFLAALGPEAGNATSSRRAAPATVRTQTPPSEATRTLAEASQTTDPQVDQAPATRPEIPPRKKGATRGTKQARGSRPLWRARRVQIGGGAAVLCLAVVLFAASWNWNATDVPNEPRAVGSSAAPDTAREQPPAPDVPETAQPGTAHERETISPFNGRDLEGWTFKEPRDRSRWTVGYARIDPQDPQRLVVAESGEGPPQLVNTGSRGSVDIYTLETFGDCTIRLEFMIPQGSNSGIYVMGEYEIQILDSYGKARIGPGDMGGLYGAAAPRVNASRAPGEWQKFEIEFRAPRVDGRGRKTANAEFVRVVLNGAVIHENVEMSGPTPAGVSGEESERGPLMFQGSHGPVALRNMTITPKPPLDREGPQVIRPRAVPVRELNDLEFNLSPWVSPDGLTIYWETGGNIQTARRLASDSPFGDSTVLFPARHPTLSADETVMVCLARDASEPVLFEVRRDSPADEWEPMRSIQELRSQPNVKSPSLSADGLTLYFQRGVLGSIEIVQSRRSTRDEPWSMPTPVAGLSQRHLGPAVDDAPCWPFLDQDELTVWLTQGGDVNGALRVGRRTSPEAPFLNFEPVVVDGRPLLGRGPVYVPATRELFFAACLSGNGAYWELWVVKDYSPSPAVQAESTSSR